MTVRLAKANTANGISVFGEAIWTVAGLGWTAWGLGTGSPLVALSGFLSFLGGGSMVTFAWKRIDPQHQVRVGTATACWAAALVAVTVLTGTPGLGAALAVFGAVQFGPHLVTAAKIARGTPADALSVPGTALRAVYTGTWAWYSLGWVAWGATGGPISWPVLVWGIAGFVAFTTQAVVATARRSSTPLPNMAPEPSLSVS